MATPTPPHVAPEEIAHQLLDAWGWSDGFKLGAMAPSPTVAGHAQAFAVALNNTGGRCIFVANAGRDWPSTPRVEARLASVARAAAAWPDGMCLRDGMPRVHLAGPLRLESGAMTLMLADGVRYFLMPVAPGRSLQQHMADEGLGHEAALLLLSAGLGAYHAMIAAAGAPRRRAPVGDAIRDTFNLATGLLSWYRSTLEATPASHPRHKLLRYAAEALDFMLGERAAQIDKLPRLWIHDDFQLKNVLWQPPSSGKRSGSGSGSCSGSRSVEAAGGAVGGAGAMPAHDKRDFHRRCAGSDTDSDRDRDSNGRITVIDVPDGSFTSRLYDFWFIVTSGSDDNPSAAFAPPGSLPSSSSAVGAGTALHRERLQARLSAYFRAGGAPLSAEERLLIINALTVKGCGTAEYYLRWAPNEALGLAALGWVQAIIEGREVLRSALDAAAAEAAAADGV